MPLGVATLHERYADVADDSARFALMAWYFEEQIAGFKPYIESMIDDADGFQMIGTSGTVTTVGAAHLGLRRYDRRKVDGMTLSARAIDEVIDRFLRLGPEGRRSDIGLGRDRSELIMSGAAILQTLLRLWPTDSMRVADRGLREGMLFAMMSARRRLRRRGAARVTAGEGQGLGARPARPARAGEDREGAQALVDALARAAAQRPLRGAGAGRGLAQPGGVQADRDRRPLPAC